MYAIHLAETWFIYFLLAVLEKRKKTVVLSRRTALLVASARQKAYGLERLFRYYFTYKVKLSLVFDHVGREEIPDRNTFAIETSAQ